MSKTQVIYKDVAPGAAGAATPSATGYMNLSQLPDLITGGKSHKTLTLEPGRWVLGDGYELMRTNLPAFWSDSLSGDDCVFTTAPVITIDFAQQFSSVGLTITFDEATGEYCRKINVKWYQQDAVKADVDFYPTGARYFCEQIVESYDRIVVTLLETSLPRRRARVQQLMFGIIRTYGMTELRSARIVNQAKMLVTELPISTATWNLDVRDDVDFMFQLKQPVEFHNGDNLIGVYYINKHSRSAKGLYSITCQDAIGVLRDIQFSGGVYTDYSAQQLVLDVVGSDFEVVFDGVTDVNLSGAIFPVAKDEALQQILFAWGVSAATDGGDVIRIFNPGAEAAEIGTDRTYTGNSTEVYSIVTAVQMTAHTYTQDDSGSVEIGGVKYKDTTEVYTVVNPNVTANDKQNVVTIDNATLISPAIAQAAAQRVYDYYALRANNKAKIVWKGERLGDLLTTPNAWGGTATGHVEKMEIILSNTIAANCETVGN